MRLMILDGNSVINRAFYGVRLLSTKDGLFTNAVYGFLNILSSLQTEVKPDAVCVAFDRKAKTFRHLRYEAYKGTRKPMPEELAQQLPLMREVLDAMRIPYYEMDGWEADDILGTAARICAVRLGMPDCDGRPGQPSAGRAGCNGKTGYHQKRSDHLCGLYPGTV